MAEIPRPVKGKAPVCIRCRRPIDRSSTHLQCACGPAFVSEPVPGTPFHLPHPPKEAA